MRILIAVAIAVLVIVIVGASTRPCVWSVCVSRSSQTDLGKCARHSPYRRQEIGFGARFERPADRSDQAAFCLFPLVFLNPTPPHSPAAWTSHFNVPHRHSLSPFARPVPRRPLSAPRPATWSRPPPAPTRLLSLFSLAPRHRPRPRRRLRPRPVLPRSSRRLPSLERSFETPPVHPVAHHHVAPSVIRHSNPLVLPCSCAVPRCCVFPV